MRGLQMRAKCRNKEKRHQNDTKMLKKLTQKHSKIIVHHFKFIWGLFWGPFGGLLRG